jgi:hypothetical protein
LGDFEKTANNINDVEGELFARKGKAKKMERILRSRFYWIELVNSIQSTLDGSDGKILVLTNPNELVPKGTNEVNQVNAEKVAEADAAVWLQSLTMTKSAASSGGQQGGFGSGEGMGEGGGGMGGMGGMGEGGGGMGGMGGMGEGGMGGMEGEGGPGGGGGGEKEAETISVIYLKLMAKNVLADAPNGEKVRTRETLNREFATMMAKQFRRNELFSDDETLTKVDGQISMKEIHGTLWFEFVIQLSLKDPIVMKDEDME